ncbi:PTS-dependent dihydroxyacetone kinase 1, dihydroxyacetone-binding subunit DhaK-like [Chelonus insularis]|uniref:PTS-dependent dihydroxyacetone kinase 1, dihydroxyacetone-binding subunit DhaK-like n=1 Tax=Chelonus insularis TaxID=460826 RepID=UPI00158990D2|nr:PTS-dependent dihydroxyacetone kinase 1, dihydroxyacetone-binding subunit DhaK-like [Chelonus insularis]
MATKKLINSVNNTVHEALTGLCFTYPQLEYNSSKRVVLIPNCNDRDDKVSIICGGGSGHEPFAAGFVGRGMLTASIAGSVFAAPPANHIYYALERVSNKAGTLVIIPNYTGDCLNFGIAIEKARQQGHKMTEIIVGDDCSIVTDEQSRVGKRGLVGMLFVMKIAGTIAERGKALDEVAYHARMVTDNLATYGVGLTPCSLPGQGLMFQLPEDEVEIGLGVHGEAGYSRIKTRSASEIVSIMLDSITRSLLLTSGNFVAVLINNFGATSQLEQGIVIYEVVTQLRKRGIEPLRVYSGALMTSLDSAGVHISVLKLPEEHKNHYIDCLDEKTDAPCWPGCAYSIPLSTKLQHTTNEQQTSQVKLLSSAKITPRGPKLNEKQTEILKECIKNACRAIIKNEKILNNLDRGCGDGDCGSTHKTLANEILLTLERLSFSYPGSLLGELSEIAEECMGGTSGAIYSLLFTSASSVFAAEDVNQKKDENWAQLWLQAWSSGLENVIKYSKTQPGDRTMIDALEPACLAFKNNLKNGKFDNLAVKKAAEAAQKGCNMTKTMMPRAGRAAYVKQLQFFKDVDAGAFGVVIWINAITETLLRV